MVFRIMFAYIWINCEKTTMIKLNASLSFYSYPVMVCVEKI